MADATSCLPSIHFSLLTIRTLTLFKVAWGPAKRLTFPDSLAANGGHMTPFQPMRHKWMSTGHCYEPTLLPFLSFLPGNGTTTLDPEGDEPVDKKTVC